jgi:DNA-binding NtrC family response regulator
MATVLYVDDDPVVRMLVRRNLEESGLEVFTAEGVQEAKVTIDRLPPDGVFIDIWLGDGTAFDLFAWMQEHHPTLTRHVAFVTGDVAPDAAAERSLSALGCPVLPKPFDMASMLGLARSWSGA